jgi:hypothetical protein
MRLMRQRSHFELDLLKRFLPAPYLFDVHSDSGNVHIESNDLEIALALRSRQIAQPAEDVLYWSIMRDHGANDTDTAITVVADNDLRTLFAGRETILIFDRSQRKVLGFIGRMDVEHVVSVLLPLLLAA